MQSEFLVKEREEQREGESVCVKWSTAREEEGEAGERERKGRQMERKRKRKGSGGGQKRKAVITTRFHQIQLWLIQDLPLKKDNAVNLPGLWWELNEMTYVNTPTRCLAPTWWLLLKLGEYFSISMRKTKQTKGPYMGISHQESPSKRICTN